MQKCHSSIFGVADLPKARCLQDFSCFYPNVGEMFSLNSYNWWSYIPCKWPYKWVTGVINLLVGGVISFITGRGAPCMKILQNQQQTPPENRPKVAPKRDESSSNYFQLVWFSGAKKNVSFFGRSRQKKSSKRFFEQKTTDPTFLLLVKFTTREILLGGFKGSIFFTEPTILGGSNSSYITS